MKIAMYMPKDIMQCDLRDLWADFAGGRRTPVVALLNNVPGKDKTL